ncbi:MAG: sulfatase-like hydrolase/transferase [Planctomycetes bacterium]|nr:sulfatase-like hydrolase/transferase [Planctomycetota bacterium]
MFARPWLVTGLAAAAAGAAAFAVAGCSLLNPEPPTNLLVIAVEGLRLDALRTALGAPRTPNIQRLTGAGVEFAWCFSHSSATMPATTALLSARTPSTSRVRVDRQEVDAGLMLVQEHLREAGWQTFGVLASPDVVAPGDGLGLARGFHIARTHPDVAPPAAAIGQELGPILERADPETPWFAFVQFADPVAPYASHGTADRAARAVLDGKPLERIGTSDPRAWKRTLHVAPGAHRIEFQADEDFVVARLEATRGGEALPVAIVSGTLGRPTRSFVASFEAVGPVAAEIEVAALLHDAPDLAEIRARYRLEVESVDRAIGDLIALLERNGQYDRTCIVLVAPHGESLGEHGEIGHGAALGDQLLRVPLVIKPPLNDESRARLAGRRLDVVRLIDVVPTLLEMLDERPLQRAEGLSLLQAGERQLLAEVHPPQARTSVLALRDARYKLVYTAGENRFEMYDVKSDTLELDNVFALQGHFRSKWQAQLRDLAERAPLGADRQIGALR